MATDGPYHCSFCGKSNLQVERLIAGPKAWICDECVGLCCHICEGSATFRTREIGERQYRALRSMLDSEPSRLSDP